MLKIRALNRESSSDEDFPVIRREAQEEIALELYNKALRLQALSDLCESEKILLNLLNENIPQLESHGPLPHSMSTLKYSCYLNIANIYLKKGEINNALDNYLNASELDSTDVTLWYKIGKLAIKQNRFRQAVYAFSKGLECSESHWPCLDQLITLLYAMKETISCLTYIGKALLLDSVYIKGLVLRKQIYKDNPAAEDYYQSFNPDYIWEPSLDVDIDEEDETKFLNEVRQLSCNITEVEKSVGPKPLQTIPLPKPLDDFTWVSLGKTIIALHQYITDNKMSHFTMVDLNKCMSQREKDPKDDLFKLEIHIKPPVEASVEDKIVEPLQEEEMEVETVVERRQSQNSDNNNDGQENTPVQTDNDEEQLMEQDGDDQEDNSDAKNDKNRQLNRGNKRKRDLLSDLQIWGWHSKRKGKKGKPDRDFSVEDAINRIIPKNLLKNKIGEEKYNQSEDSMNTMDIYNMYVEDHQINFLSPIHSPRSINYEDYFDTEREKEDVVNIWAKKREFCDSIILVKDFVLALSKLWHTKWPKELIAMYLEVYDMFREHYDIPQVFCEEISFEQIRDEALATLLYGELLNFSPIKDEPRNIHVTALAFLQLISGWHNEWQNEFCSVFIRFYWLRAHIFRKEGYNDLAVRALELIQEIITEEENKTGDNFFLSLPNCFKCSLITNEIVSKILKHLDMITSLSCLEELYNAEKYKEVADILKLTFKNSGSHPTCGRMGRPAQLAMLLHCLWYTDLTNCFIWTEECLYEGLGHFLKPTRDPEKWEKVVEKCLAFLHDIIKMETVSVVDCLMEEKRARLVDTLCKIVCKQLNFEGSMKIPLGCITPWILLHYILVREEHRLQASKRISHVKNDRTEYISETLSDDQNDELPPSVAILFSAHEFLGPKGWCLTGNGEFLHFMLDSLLDRLDTPILEPLREKIDIHIEQALFCLYQHPSKKNKISRHLADHNVDPLPLSWERASQLYEFYGPDCLPEFNSYKNASIPADTEQLLQRIIALVPPENDPLPRVQKITDYLSGKTNELPESINFPNKVRAIYYLIGDYYFKQREFNRCLKYFLMDLCINPQRVDSWACMGLSYLSQLENKLNYCKKMKNEMEFLDKAKCAQICFKRALNLDSAHIMLWIEFGSFQYMVHSFCSRIMKSESDTLSMEKFEYLENQKNSYLESSGCSFEKAIELYHQCDEADADERWLQYYILGKVAEKKQREPSEYLQYYITASKLLHENNAIYPEKINYHNPQHLAVEALELYYRINASILKYLELHEGKEINSSIGNGFKKYLDNSMYPKKIAVVKESTRPAQPKATDIIQQGLNLSIGIPEQPSAIDHEINEKLKKEELRQDVKKCIEDMLLKVDDMIKKQAEIANNQNNKDQNNIEIISDIIVLSDSDDDQNKIQLELKSSERNSESNSKDVQDLLDKMMAETMRNTNEQIETDSETSKGVVENKVEVQVENEKKKDESETDSNIRTSVDDSSSTSSSSTSSSSSSESDSEDDSSSSSSSSSSAETPNEHMSNGEILALIDRCIAGLEQCIVRLPQNYKALYRLAHLYFNYKGKKDLTKCRQLLLGEYSCKEGTVVSGLFTDRKNHNFFNGIWRIPSSEIDRPGSLSAHMSRCITLLLQILRATNDNKTLLDLYMQFKKIPDPDKVYIKDSERVQFAEQSMTMCIQSFRSQIQNFPNMNDNGIQKLLQDIFKAYQRVQKHIPGKESTFSQMLTEVFKQYKKEKIPENVNTLDLATKFCQQSKLAEKQKKQIQSQTALLRSPGVTAPPVLPRPSLVGPTSSTPLKRPGMGRPRGRPPLPKILGQSRSPRGRSPNVSTNSYTAWQKPLFDQNTTYNYLKHYQEELIKQYSQSLSISQLTQLSQYLTQNQLAQSQYASQFLMGQNPLMNPLLKQFSTMADKTANFKTTPSMPFSSGNLNIESLKNFNDMNNPSTKSSTYKKNLPHTITSPGQATIAKVSTTSPSANVYMNLPHTIPSSIQSSILNFPQALQKIQKPYPKIDNKVITHSIASITQPPTCKVKTIPQTYKSVPVKYGTADISKMKTSVATKTKPSTQVFKEPTITKAYPSIHHKPVDKSTNILMKDRPNISITPVIPSAGRLITTSPSSYIPPLQTSPGKTLQEKLADKQKQQLAKHLGRNIEAEIITKDSNSGTKKTLNIPPSLSVSKTPPIKFPLESGISISQIPLTQVYKPTIEKSTNIQQKKFKPADVILPPNLPISLSVLKKPEKKPSLDDDDVIIIE